MDKCLQIDSYRYIDKDIYIYIHIYSYIYIYIDREIDRLDRQIDRQIDRYKLHKLCKLYKHLILFKNDYQNAKFLQSFLIPFKQCHESPASKLTISYMTAHLKINYETGFI